jgi:hypothetical protein
MSQHFTLTEAKAKFSELVRFNEGNLNEYMVYDITKTQTYTT